MTRRRNRVTPSLGEQWRDAQERKAVPPIAGQPSDAEIFGADPDACGACAGFGANPSTGQDCPACGGAGRVDS